MGLGAPNSRAAPGSPHSGYATGPPEQLCAMLGQRVRDNQCETLYRSFTRAPVGTDSDRTASSLLSRLGKKKQERWEEAVNSINFSHCSRKVWRTINKLTGRSGCSFHQCPISSNSITSQLVKNETHMSWDRKSTRLVNKELSDLWKIPTPEGHSISEPFKPEELIVALRRLKPGKSPGLDTIFPEFILHTGWALKSWFCNFLSSCMRQLKIPKIWRRALIVGRKAIGDPKSYRPISLLCVAFKILERLIYARVDAIIDPLLPREQAGFLHWRSTVDQVTLLTQDIEDSFSAKKKAGAVFVDITAAYNIVWHCGPTYNLLQLLPDRHMVHMILEMVSNRRFTLTTENAWRFKSRHPFVHPPHNNSSVYLTTTSVRRSGWITNGMRSGRTASQDSAFLYPTLALPLE